MRGIELRMREKDSRPSKTLRHRGWIVTAWLSRKGTKRLKPHIGVTSSFAQNRTLSGKGQEIRVLHKQRYADG